MGLAERERYDEAVEQLEAAVDSDSRFSMAWAQLARIELIRNNAAGLKRAVEGLRPLDRGLAERFAREFEQPWPHNDVPSP